MSRYQGEINWKKVAADPKVGFVYIKATEGRTLLDPNYKYNIREARKAGLKVGSYHFFTMLSTPQEQFAQFKQYVKKEEQDLIPMIDFENSYGKSKSEIQRNLDIFIDSIVAYYGVKPMIYSTHRHYNDLLAPTYNRFHLYIGRYGTKKKAAKRPEIIGKGTYTIWQFSETGHVSGISKPVDLCRFHPNHRLSEITIPKEKKNKK